MKKTLIWIVLLTLSLCSYVGFAQRISIDSALTKWNKDYPQEKVFFQTDKTLYAQHETIWMKVWCTLDGTPSFLSKIVYIDLVDNNGNVIQKKMYQLDGLSTTPMTLEISEDISSGNYSIDVYTLWMKNFPNFIATKKIYIVGKDYERKHIETKPSVHIDFFPEGGNIIDGQTNKIAFKLYNQNGFPINDITGNLYDGANNNIAVVKPIHDGMGIFTYKAEINKQYKVGLEAANGATQYFPLPKAVTQNASLSIDNSNPNRILVNIVCDSFFINANQKVKIVVEVHGQVIFAQMMDIASGQTAAAIAKKGAPAGIAHITLFDSEDHPISERLAFIENYELNIPQILSSHLSWEVNGKNNFTFQLPALDTASISVLVTDAFQLKEDSSFLMNNIATSILFDADLKGEIYNAGYYIRNKSKERLQALDLLLMTQGWSRYKWEEILTSNFTKIKYPVESGLSITGEATKSDRTDLIKDGFVSFIIKTKDSSTIIGQAPLNTKGQFLFDSLNFKQKAKVYYMGTDNKRNKYIIDIKFKSNYIDTFSKNVVGGGLNLDTSNLFKDGNITNKLLKATLAQFKDSHELEQVTVTTKGLSSIDSLNKLYTEGPFAHGTAINPADFKNYRSVWSIIQAAVPGVEISGNPLDPKVSFSRFNGLDALSQNTASMGGADLNGVSEENGIAYFLNGINVDKTFINTLSVDDIALIKILKTEASVLGASQGAIAIYTKSGEVYSPAPYDKTYQSFTKEGFSLVKEYYSNNVENLQKEDMRSLLFWKGRMSPNKANIYNFSFIANNDLKAFSLTIQGISREGKLILFQKNYNK